MNIDLTKSFHAQQCTNEMAGLRKKYSLWSFYVALLSCIEFYTLEFEQEYPNVSIPWILRQLAMKIFKLGE